jgi:uncharacterized NAD(P)/FAD-binding protein YdhS
MRVAIVGAGYSGTIAAAELARLGAEAVLVDLPGRFAKGAAYSTGEAAHLLNVRARGMSAFEDDPDHFLRWAEAERLGGADTFVPRRDYARYLAEILAEARASGRVALAEGRAASLDPEGLRLESGELLPCGAAILAGGNFPSRLPWAEAVHDPWSAAGADAVRALAEGAEDVLLVGTGLTMVDMCLTLAEAGFGGRMLATSRRGLVPRAHVPLREEPLHASAPAGLLEAMRSVRRAARVEGWRPAVDALRPVSRQMWRGWSEAERRRFLRHARPWWDVHRHRIAPPVAARIEALRREGRLEVEAGRILSFAGGEVRIARRGGGTLLRRVAGAINCTGPEGSIARVEDPLIRSLIAGGRARQDRLGLGLDVDEDSRVIGRDGKASERLFALGPLTRGGFWEIVAVPDIRGQARAVARLAAGA